MARRGKWPETGRQQRPRREAPGGHHGGGRPGPRSPSYRPGGQHPTSEQERAAHTESATIPGPVSLHWGCGANRHPETWRRGFREWSPDLPAGSQGLRSGEAAGPRAWESGRGSPACHRPGVSLSRALPPGAPPWGRSEGAPGVTAGGGDSDAGATHQGLQHPFFALHGLCPPPLPVPRCLWAAGAPSTRGLPAPSRAPRGGSQAGGPPITRLRPLGQPSGLPCCVRA